MGEELTEGDLVQVKYGSSYGITTPGSWGVVDGFRVDSAIVCFFGVGPESCWLEDDCPKRLGTRRARFFIRKRDLVKIDSPPTYRGAPMAHKYKVGDVVLSIDGYIEEEDETASNQLCIVRKVEKFNYFEPRRNIVYRCTTIATGEEIDLYEDEIVPQAEQADG